MSEDTEQNFGSWWPVPTAVFCVLTSCSLVDGSQGRRGVFYFHLDVRSWRWNRLIPPERWCPPTRLHDAIMTLRIAVWIFNPMKTAKCKSRNFPPPPPPSTPFLWKPSTHYCVNESHHATPILSSLLPPDLQAPWGFPRLKFLHVFSMCVTFRAYLIINLMCGSPCIVIHVDKKN